MSGIQMCCENLVFLVEMKEEVLRHLFSSQALRCTTITSKNLATGELLYGEFCLSVFISMVFNFCI